MTLPLEGVRVVEIASFVAAPSGGALLADLGAEVIKVEVPHGEVYRHAVPRMNGYRSDFPESPAFQMDNRGKRSLALDLTRPAARTALARVIERADVVLTNLLPERAARYGVDPDTLRRAHPALIYARLTGYGARGPDADRPGFDYAAYWARTGFMDLMREAGTTPVWQRPGIGDHAAGISLVAGILAALRVRDRTGEGQVVEVSLLQIGLYVQGNDLAAALATRQNPQAHDRTRPRNPLWNAYPTGDGRWLFLVMIESDRYWPVLCRALECPDWTRDPRFDSAVTRYKNNTELVSLLDARFRALALAEWEKRFADFELIWSPMREMTELFDDPQIRAMGYWRAVDHPTAGRFETMGPPFDLSATPLAADQPAPALGADGAAVLRESGLSADEISAALGTPR